MSIVVRSVTKAFDETGLFRDVTFELPSGEVGVLTGPSGSGKTTLLRILAGLEDFSGVVTVDGRVVSKDAPTPSVTLVPQRPSLWSHLSVLENVSLVARLARGVPVLQARELSSRLLERLDIHALANRYPASLSGGEQQRAALARGVVADRRVLLLDEITANVDAARRDRILSLLEELGSGGCTILLATHDMFVIRKLRARVWELQPEGALSVLRGNVEVQ